MLHVAESVRGPSWLVTTSLLGNQPTRHPRRAPLMRIAVLGPATETTILSPCPTEKAFQSRASIGSNVIRRPQRPHHTSMTPFQDGTRWPNGSTGSRILSWNVQREVSYSSFLSPSYQPECIKTCNVVTAYQILHLHSQSKTISSEVQQLDCKVLSSITS